MRVGVRWGCGTAINPEQLSPQLPRAKRMSTQQRGLTQLQAESVIDASADDTLVEFDRDVRNDGRSAYVGDSAIGSA
jgi:hypothetical protein